MLVVAIWLLFPDRSGSSDNLKLELSCERGAR